MNFLDSIRDSASVQVVLLLIVSIVLVALGVYILIRLRRDSGDKERRRRLSVNSTGRLGDATITDVHDHAVFYEYSISGVSYTASQDISQLLEHISVDIQRLIGPASVKYSPRNPANSIILCEEWSGLRIRPNITES